MKMQSIYSHERFMQTLWRLPLTMRERVGPLSLFVVTLIFGVKLLAATKKQDPTIMTNFLTEDDLNRWFVKILWALGIAVGPVILGQILSIWNESRHSAKNDVKELKSQQQEFLTTLSRIEDQLQILRERPYLSASDVHKIAREESEKSIEFMERIKHRI